MTDPSTVAEPTAGTTRGAVPARGRDVLSAWGLLVATDVLLQCFSFGRLCRVIARCPTRGSLPEAQGLSTGRGLCEAVSRARVYYFRRAWCLQSAAAAVVLLRLRGVDSHLVIGVRKLPFYAHAWVEVSGEIVLNARADLASYYKEILRC